MSFLRKRELSPKNTGTTPDNVLLEEEFENGEYRYAKKFTVGENRYFIIFEHTSKQEDGDISLHFGLDNTAGNPITNAGLEVFGKIADEMSLTYEEIIKSRKINHIHIFASADTFEKEDLVRIKEIIAKDPSKLDKITFIDVPDDFEVEFKDGVAIVVTDIYGKSDNPPPPYTIPITASVVDDIKHIAKVDISKYIPDIINQINGGELESKKQNQRLKLYQFYLQRRYPQFTFNSKETVGENGKRELEFEMNENGEPYLLVTTNN